MLKTPHTALTLYLYVMYGSYSTERLLPPLLYSLIGLTKGSKLRSLWRVE